MQISQLTQRARDVYRQASTVYFDTDPHNGRAFDAARQARMDAAVALAEYLLLDTELDDEA